MTARKRQLEARKPPIQRRAKATVGDILAASAQVFEEHGYAAGTTNRIAKRAGVSIGTVYQYFPSKEAIAVALLEQHVSRTTHQLHEWVGHMVVEQHGLREALHDYVTGILSMHAGSPRLQHILIEETTLPERVPTKNRKGRKDCWVSGLETTQALRVRLGREQGPVSE